jgi:uncharacterized protein (DUF427 family)
MKPERIEPGPGQESVWDYPRPPRVEASSRLVQVIFNGVVIAESRLARRVLETSHPPAYYIPPQDVRLESLEKARGSSFCEWKGSAIYYNIVVGDRRVERGAWSYPQPASGFESIRGYLAFYAGLMDACFVDGEKVRPQPGGFYGGWVTDDVLGPFKGEPGTMGW